MTVEQADVFGVRLRAGRQGIYLTQTHDPTGDAEVVPLRNGSVGRRWRDAITHFTECVSRPFNLQHDNLIRFAIAPITSAETLLLLAADHTVADGQSMGLLLQRVARGYGRLESGDLGGAQDATDSYSFLRHARSALAMDELWADSEAYWKALARAHHAQSLAFGLSKPWFQRRIDSVDIAVLSRKEQRSLRDLAAAWQVSLGDLLTAATTLLVSPAVDQPASIVCFRHGRSMPRAARVLGPLREQVFTSPPTDVDVSVRQWVQALRANQLAAPPLVGRAIEDVWGNEAVRDRSAVTANVRPFVGTLDFGRATGGSLDMTLREKGERRPDGCALEVMLLGQRGGPWRLVTHFDRAMYPTKDGPTRLVRRLLRRCVDYPEGTVRETVRGVNPHA